MDRADRVIILVFMIIALAIGLPLLNAVRYYYEDSYTYLGLAESIGQLKYEVYEIQHNKYLPGYPAAVALLHGTLGLLPAGLFPGSGRPAIDDAGKLVCLLSRVFLIPVIYRLALRLSGRTAAILAGLTATLHTYSILYGALVYSEPLASLFIALAIWAMFRSSTLFSGLWAGLAIITRPEAIFLLPTRLVFSGSSLKSLKEWSRLSGFAITALMFIVPWLIFNYIRSRGISYVQEVLPLAHSGVTFLSNYTYVLGLFFLVFCITGFVFQFWKKETQTILFFILCHMVLHIWWWWNDDRFVMQVFPLLVVYAGTGMARAASYLTNSRTRLLGGVCLIAALVFQFYSVGIPLFRREAERSRVYVDAIRSLDRFDADSGVITADPGLVCFNSRHRPYGIWTDVDQSPVEFLFHAYWNHGVRHLLVSDTYAMDMRIIALDIRDSREFDAVVTGGSDMRRYKMTVTLLDTFRGLRTAFNPNYSRLFAVRHETRSFATTSVYSVTVHEVPLQAFERFDAVVIDRKTLQGSLN